LFTNWPHSDLTILYQNFPTPELARGSDSLGIVCFVGENQWEAIALLFIMHDLFVRQYFMCWIQCLLQFLLYNIGKAISQT
jgi:hypothetical protein